MRRLFRLRVLFVVVLAAAIAAAVSTFLTQMQRMQGMTAEERRQYLGDKLGSKIPDEQIDQIAAAISAKLDEAASKSEEMAEVAEAVAEAAEDVVDEAAEAIEEAAEAVEEAAEED